MSESNGNAKKKRRNNQKPVQCPNNEGVFCLKPTTCNGCGWDPAVAEKRLAAIKNDLGIEE